MDPEYELDEEGWVIDPESDARLRELQPDLRIRK